MEFAWPATPLDIQAYKVYAEDQRQWPGIQRGVQGCEVQGLIPRDVLSGNEDQLFAQRSVLGFIKHNHYKNEIAVINRITMKQVLPAGEPSHKLKSALYAGTWLRR